MDNRRLVKDVRVVGMVSAPLYLAYKYSGGNAFQDYLLTLSTIELGAVQAWLVREGWTPPSSPNESSSNVKES